MSNVKIPRSNVVHGRSNAQARYTHCGRPTVGDIYSHPFASDMVTTSEPVTCKRCLIHHPNPSSRPKTKPPTKADLVAQRDRARELTKALTARLKDEHDAHCGCGSPSVGDCATSVLLHNAQRHLDHWEATAPHD